MPKGYWIGRVDVKSDEGYKPYAIGNQAIFKKFGGRYVIRAGKFECAEGSARSRNVVIEFPDPRHGACLLQFARISAKHEAAPAARHRRYRCCRGLRRPAAVVTGAQARYTHCQRSGV